MRQLFNFPLALCLAAAAIAGEPEAASLTPEPRFKISGWVDNGITFNPASPADNQNFGRFFDDRVNEPLLNQLVINFERALAPQPGQFDWGFKLQFMYGSDARFIHSLGLFSNTAGTSIVQPDLPEAYLSLHFPFISEGGLDLKLGKFVTLEGAETIDPRTNFFYSHTYIFDFGIPFNHTGGLAIFHATKWLDLYSGITRGVNTSIEDNNDNVSFPGGVGLNLLDGKPTIDPRTVGGGHTTYGAITAGVNIKPTMAKPISSLNIRPELRYDRALNGTHPFNQSSDVDQFTVGVDCILTF